LERSRFSVVHVPPLQLSSKPDWLAQVTDHCDSNLVPPTEVAILSRPCASSGDQFFDDPGLGSPLHQGVYLCAGIALR